ncbi:ATP-dependent DNA helicase [Neobacillus sp. LXY-4]|uniref:ATP-dependent DNA helicase n=1 Tax=Neobacillus sp. LXY-4 TaxID=3379826 RepID=UPI003EE3D1AB
MKWLFAPILLFTQWYYIPLESPGTPAQISSIQMNLKDDELALTFFSLSDGEAALIQHPNGDNVLINTGGNGTEQELRNLLELYHIRKLDQIILTSEKSCCFQNLNWLIDDYGVESLLTRRGAENDLPITSSRKTLNLQLMSSGMVREIVPGLMMEVLNDQQGLNLSLQFLNRRVLWFNTPDSNREKYLLKDEQVNTTIIKLPSEATEHFISAELIEQLDPQIAFLFPHKSGKELADLLEQLQHAWVHVYSNNHKGAVTIKFTEDNYEVFRISDQEK